MLAVACSFAAAAHSRPAPDGHHSPRFTLVQRLRHGLAGTPMQPEAWLIERQARRWDVSPFLIAAISGAESSFGEHRCGFNAWGVGSCRGYNYSSWTEAVGAVARLLRTGYLDGGARSVWDIGRSYCPGCGSWPGTVAVFMERMGASPYVVTYRR